MGDSKRQIEQAVARLQQYHAMGRESLEQNSERVPYGTSSELLRKARLFADQYTASELEQLVLRCEKYSRAVGRSMVDRLATVEKEERTALELEAIQQRWSKADLDRVIRTRYGSRHRHKGLGRLPTRPTDVDDALSELSRLSHKLSRWLEMMQSDEVPKKQVALRDLPKSVKEHADTLIPNLAGLQQALERSMNRRRKRKRRT